jgi:hypothetical protein
MFEITNPITNERLQVAEKDFGNPMDWLSAVTACKNLGNGWRLPTKFEFDIIYKEIYKNNIGNFESNSCYWTNTESKRRMFFFWKESKNAYFFHMSDNFKEGYYNKDEEFLVRAVRTL